MILIDCAPSLGLLTINALTAADEVIMPLECEFFALRGIALLTDTIAKVQDRLNPRLEILGILGTMYDPRTLHSREVLERVVEAFGEQVFHTVIRRTVKFPETTVAGEPITTYAPTRRERRLTAPSPVRCWPDAASGRPGGSLGNLFRGRRDGGTSSLSSALLRQSRRAARVRRSGTTRRSPSTSAPRSWWRWSRPG